MDFWGWLTRGRKIQNSGVAAPSSWLVEWMRGSDSDSDISMSYKTALSYAPIWYAVNKIAGHLGQLPCILYQQQGYRQKLPATRHPGYKLMKIKPNRWMTPPVFREILTAHALLNGNGRAAIERNNRSEPAELIPLLPHCTVTVLVNDVKWHVVTDPATGEKTKLNDYDVVHIPGLSYDGIQGYSVIDMLKNSVGLGLAGEKQGNRHFRNNSTPSLVLEAPPGTFAKEEDARKFLADWNKYHSGLDNSNRTALLRNGIKATTLSVNARDSQWIEQRKFQRQEAALWMMLEQILGDDSSVSYNSLEQKNMAYYTNCLMKWVTKWEYELNDKLLTTQQFTSESHFFKFNANALLRGTIKDRFDVYEKARMMKVYSANDVRDLEDMNAISDGDEYENPAITPASPEEEVDDESGDEGTSAVQSQADIEDSLNREREQRRTAIATRIRDLIVVEVHRVNKAAEKEKKFVVWLDGFYSDQRFGGRISSVYQHFGGDLVAEQHIEQSMGTLLEIAGKSQADTLHANVVTETETWCQRADALADMVLNAKVGL